ncbi:choice-of-anchor D domain-containing protein [Flavobacterium ajazii]|uniref:choice-of-anchor D domain-containing protein n=1 Tax=Flavobacterium ajazii TaxID=2692318 RepID=UPI0013D6FF5D|nr:choice-of-anchor D domain-containing protein [Flavobacterium ajazii]
MKYKLPKSFFITVKLLFISLKIFSQAPNYAGEPSIQSPNATSLGKFGDIPVSLFTGAPNINIPLTEIKNGSIIVPINLQYDAGGCRPDQHPTWVGLNWSLQAGGVIRRVTNGRFDEHVDRDFGVVNSYYSSYNKLAVADWNTSLNYTNIDLSPDEFSFVVNNISGKFMLDHEGKWIVQSKENMNLKVVHEIQTNYSINLGSGNTNIPRSFTKFILTAGDGTKYIFGGQSTAIEFSAPAMPSGVEPYNNTSAAYIDPVELERGWQNNIQPSAWHLSEIISPSGNHIYFYYTTDFSFQQVTYSELSKGVLCGPADDYHYNYDINQNNKYLIKSAYLDRIETDNGLICSFSKSISNELNWVFKSKIMVGDYFPMKPSYLYRYHKLDGIEIKLNDKTAKKISLGYIEKSTERLKLKEVKFLSVSGDQTASIYRIEYNNKLLPNYNSGFEDHWGYYNGTNYWGNLSEQGNTFTQLPNMVDYYQSREANSDFMDAEIITKIVYPTGGYSRFTFEPHDYSKLVKQNPSITLEELSANKIAGGLRIKKIETFDAFSSVPQLKEYFYINNYLNEGALSSGILSGEPVYYEAGTHLSNWSYQFYKFSSNPLVYLNTTNGNHITYSQVTEKSSEGYIVYNYANQDNGSLDKEPFAKANNYSAISKNEKKLFGKLDLERGRVLNTKYYAEDKFLLKEVTNEYNNETSRYNKYVRSIQDAHDPYRCGYTIVALPIYTFYPYLKKKTNIEYFRNGTLKNIEINYTYDANSNLLRTTSVFNSEGTEIRTKYKYPIDYTNVPLAPIPILDEIHDIASLVSNNVVNVPIEINNSVVKAGVEYITGGKLNYYEDLKLEKTFELETTSFINSNDFNFSTANPSGFIFDSRYKEKIFFSKYDNKGNPLEVKQADGITTSYVWGYNNQYPIAKVINANYQDITNILGATNLAKLNNGYIINPGPPPSKLTLTDTETRSLLNPLRTNLANAEVSIFTYQPLAGITSQTDSKGLTTYYEYDNFDRLKFIKDYAGNVVKDYKYNYKEFKRISLSTHNLSFDNVPYGSSVSKKIKITNSSNLNFTVSGLTVPTGYSYIVNGSSTLAPGDSVDITITFSPSIVGSYPGTITVLSDAEGLNTISVNGSGVISKIINISGDLDFGWMFTQPGNPYGCASRTMTITNQGNTTLTITGIQTENPFTVNWTNGTISPGQSKNITVSFCPPDRPYYFYEATLNVISDKTAGISSVPVFGAAETTN